MEDAMSRSKGVGQSLFVASSAEFPSSVECCMEPRPTQVDEGHEEMILQEEWAQKIPVSSQDEKSEGMLEGTDSFSTSDQLF